MISKITLKNVRRFTNIDIPIQNKNVIITGNNAIGKTTILEAISLASVTKSHRTNVLKEIIKENADFSVIEIKNNNNLFRVVLSKDGKTVSINKNEIKKLSDYIGKFKTVFFSPNDLILIHGSPSLRRQFLNQEISQLFPEYIRKLNLYIKLLNERNNCLKNFDNNQNEKILDIITEQLIDAAKPIIEYRNKFINLLNNKINEVHSKLNLNEQIKLVYLANVTKENMEEQFNNHKNSDIKYQQTTVGPQRDDIKFLINDKDASVVASQGQIRSIVLSLKIALCEVIKDECNEYPILLLDDVLSELDSNRQNNLLNIVSNLGQIFITTVDTSLCNKDLLKKYQIINL